MLMFIIGLIALLVALVMLVIAKKMVSKSYEKPETKKESKILPPFDENYSGLPAIEWNEKLPDKVDDYVRPRYVYENLVESETLDPSQGHIIGYRISPTLVIHDMVGRGSWSKDATVEFCKYYKGTLLTYNEFQTLKCCWKHLSKMRQDAGDIPFPEGGLFWIYGYEQMGYPYFSEKSLFAQIIMKR